MLRYLCGFRVHIFRGFSTLTKSVSEMRLFLPSPYSETLRHPTIGIEETTVRQDRQRQGRAGKRVWLGGHVGPAWPVLLWRHAHHQEARAHGRTLRRKVGAASPVIGEKTDVNKYIYIYQVRRTENVTNFHNFPVRQTENVQIHNVRCGGFEAV